MYHVYFEVWRGFSSPTLHPAGSFETLDEAVSVARVCYGYVQHGRSIIKDYRIQ